MFALDPPLDDGAPDPDRCTCGVLLVEHDEAGGPVCPCCDLDEPAPDSDATARADYLLDLRKDP